MDLTPRPCPVRNCMLVNKTLCYIMVVYDFLKHIKMFLTFTKSTMRKIVGIIL